MDKETLAQKLAALSSDGETYEHGRRIISDGQEPPILTAILAEIDMTVLPRKLTFRMNESEITLVAGVRRLRGLVKASKDIKGVVGVLGKSLDREEPDVIAGLRGILDQFTATAGQLTVESDEPDAMGGQTEAGLMADTLAELWDVSVHAQPQTPMQRFVRNCGPLATAWIVMDQADSDTSGGDGTQLSALKRALSKQWSDFSKTVDQLTDEHGFICLNNALGDVGSVAIAKMSGEAALICYPSDKMTEIHSSWTTYSG